MYLSGSIDFVSGEGIKNYPDACVKIVSIASFSGEITATVAVYDSVENENQLINFPVHLFITGGENEETYVEVLNYVSKNIYTGLVLIS